MRRFIVALATFLFLAQTSAAQEAPVQTLLQEYQKVIVKSSRKTIGPAIDALASSGFAQAQTVLQKWQSKEMYLRKNDGLFFHGESIGNKTIRLFDFDTGEQAGDLPKSDLKQIKPNSGIRALLGAALVQFQLSDPDPSRRRDALQTIQRDAEASHLPALRASIETEADPEIRAAKTQLERLLTVSFDQDEAARLKAIADISGQISLDVRGTLNPLLNARLMASVGDVPSDKNIARVLRPGGGDLSRVDAYDLLVDAKLAPPRISDDTVRDVLTQNIQEARVGGIPVARLSDRDARIQAYSSLADQGKADPFVTEQSVSDALAAHVFYQVYTEPSAAVTSAARKALSATSRNVAANQALDLTLDALSLASIFFLAAIGLAITFGVMGVINMAHGEFIMMGAYTGYVVQQIIPNYTVSIIVALPLAFAVTFAAGVAMERLVIRWLYDRPLETLLATFGISIALQQIAKNIFGTQARPLTSPAWLDGAWVMNDVVSISYIRIAIFVLAALFLAVFLFIMKKTRLGLETRAVTQNPRMAASMGINPDKVNMLTFGLGSGIAGIAGVAIGLFAKVTSELGNDYIVQSFMTVVVGGVGNIWGTLSGAVMIGFFQKGVEWLNPSNTLAAQTYMIIFIIIFIQFRPRGIIALKGRAAGD